jgi:molybdopterin-guanine dinucleotide biosynthesis protein A
MTPIPDLAVVIQAGGLSTRMGRNKALLSFLGEPLILRIARRLEPLTSHLIVVANPIEPFLDLGLTAFPDQISGLGPLGGLFTAFSCAAQKYVAVVACDMPFVNSDLIAYAFGILQKGDLDAVLPESTYGLEPLHAVYRRETCLAPVEKALQAGERRLISWLPVVKSQTISLPEVRQFDPDLLAFTNINTPEDLAAFEQMAMNLNKKAKP